MKRLLLAVTVLWLLGPSLALAQSLINPDTKEGKILLDIVAAERGIAKAKHMPESRLVKQYVIAASYALYTAKCIEAVDKKEAESLFGIVNVLSALGSEFYNEHRFMELTEDAYASMIILGNNCESREEVSAKYSSVFHDKIDFLNTSSRILESGAKVETIVSLATGNRTKEQKNTNAPSGPNNEDNADNAAADAVAQRAVGGLTFLALLIGISIAVYTKRRHEAPRPSGIAGWLLFFIVLNGVLGTITAFVEITGLLAAKNTYPYAKTAIYIYLLFYAAYIVIFYYSLHALATIKESAVRLIKIILTIQPLITLITPGILVLLIALTTPVVPLERDLLFEACGRAYTQEVFAGLILTAFYSIVWYAYFCNSVRVKNTWDLAKRKKERASPIVRGE